MTRHKKSGVVPGDVIEPRRCGRFARRSPGSSTCFRFCVHSLVLCVYACMGCFPRVETRSARPFCPQSRTASRANLHWLCPAKIAHGMIMHRVSHKPGQPKQCCGSAVTTLHAEHGAQLAGSMQLRQPARRRKAVRAVLWMRMVMKTWASLRRTVEV